MKTRINVIKAGALAALLAAALAHCGQTSSQDKSQTGGVWPASGQVIQTSQPIRFNITRAAMKSPGDSYSIAIYKDAYGEQKIASTTVVDRGAAEGVVWSPSGAFIIEPNTQYWWEWIGGSGAKSGFLTFFASSWQGGKPISPRDGGYMDRNMRQTPTLGVSNIYSGPGLAPTYDFQLFDSLGAAKPIAEKLGLTQTPGENHTRYSPPVTLADGGVYYWRARVNAPGITPQWSKLNVFTVTDVCSIDGPGYAAWAIDWVPKRCANIITHGDMTEALGTPNATAEYTGFISMDYGGELFLEMGMTITDSPGPEIQVFEFVSTEFLEVFVGPTEAGPWTSLGAAFCHAYCEFDLAIAGVRYARYIRIRDLDAQGYICHDTSGCDIDSVLWYRGKRSPEMCATRWW
jgi:hypothetical protein